MFRTLYAAVILICTIPQICPAQTKSFQQYYAELLGSFEQKRYSESGALIRHLEAKYPSRLKGLAQYHFIKGRLLFLAEKEEESTREYLLARDLFKHQNDDRKVALTEGRIAVNLTRTGNFQEAEKYAKRSMAYYISRPADQDYMDSRFDLGTIYLNTGEYLRSAEIFLENLKFYEQGGTVVQLGRAYSQVGLAYDYAGLNEKAERYYIRAIEYREQAKDTVGLMNTYNNLGIVNKNTGRYPRALNYYQRSYDLAHESGRETYKINPLVNMGVAARNMGQIKTAINFYEEALSLARKYRREAQIATVANNLAFLYNSTRQFELALPLARNAVDFAEQKGTLEDKAEYWQNYSVSLNGLSRQGEAYEALLKSRAFSDSLYRSENSRSMLEMAEKYETEKKEQQIRLLNVKTLLQESSLRNQELELQTQKLALQTNKLDLNNKNLLLQQKEGDIRQRSLEAEQQQQAIISLKQKNLIQDLQIRQRNTYLLVAGVALAALMLVVYLVYNRRKLREQTRLQEEIHRQQELAASAVLNAEAQERRRIAADLHDGLGQLLSSALMTLNGLLEDLGQRDESERAKARNALDLITESYDEMRSISHLMMPDALVRAGLVPALNDFVNKIDKNRIRVNLDASGLAERIEPQTENIVYRVIQESVSNVIKHSGASTLDIQLSKDEDGLSVTVEDNGRGFDVGGLNNASGIGMKNIISRIEYLRGTVDIDSSEGRGTLIAIQVPA